MRLSLLVLLLLLSLVFALNVELKRYKGFYLSDGTFYKMIETTISPHTDEIFIEKLSVFNYEISVGIGGKFKKVSENDIRLGRIPLIHLVKGTKCKPGHRDCKQKFITVVYPTDTTETHTHRMTMEFQLNDHERTKVRESIEIVVDPKTKISSKTTDPIIRIYQNDKEIHSTIDSSKPALIKVYPRGHSIEVNRIDMIYGNKCVVIHGESKDTDCQLTQHSIKQLKSEGTTFVFRYIPISRINRKVKFKVHYKLKNAEKKKYWSFDDWDENSKIKSKFMEFHRKKYDRIRTVESREFDCDNGGGGGSSKWHFVIIIWIIITLVCIAICIALFYKVCYKRRRRKKRKSNGDDYDSIKTKVISYAGFSNNDYSNKEN